MGWWNKIMGNDESWRTLSARVLEEEHVRYSELAKLRGLTVSAFVRETMQVLYPQELFEEQKANLREQAPADPEPTLRVVGDQSTTTAPPTPAIRVAAVEDFVTLHESSVLDLEDQLTATFAVHKTYNELSALGDFSQTMSPNRDTPVVSVLGATGGSEPSVHNARHPCRHLNTIPPLGHTLGDCQGSCLVQHSRPCHWPANVAADCLYYKPLVTGPHRNIG